MHVRPIGVFSPDMSDSLARLYRAVRIAKSADPATSRTARLLRAGRTKMAKKVAEEAVEVVIDAMNGHSDAAIAPSNVKGLPDSGSCCVWLKTKQAKLATQG